MVIYDLEKSILIIPDGNIVDNGIWQSGYTSGYTDGARSGSGSSYSDGYNDGIAYQKSLLASTAITSNGNYNRPDGYSSVSVNIPQTGQTQAYNSGYTNGYNSGYTDGVEAASGSSYSQGYTDGEAAQKAKLVATAVTSNGTYSRPDGYSSINVSVPQTGHTDAELQQAFNSGYSAGIAYQKGLLVSTAFTENGTYTRENGYGTVVVNVSGSVVVATALTLNVPSAITNTGLATVTVNPSGAVTNIVYSSSDPTIATISSAGVITVLSSGTVTITVVDTISNLSASTQVTVNTYPLPVSDYLTFECVSAGTLSWSKSYNLSDYHPEIQYRKNGGEWTTIAPATGDGTSMGTMEVGDIVEVKGDNNRYSHSSGQYFCNFKGTGYYNVYGDLSSMCNWATSSEEQKFKLLFYQFNVVDASDLYLLNINLTESCFYNLFYYCASLTAVPRYLKSEDLKANCYGGMFENCTSLTGVPSDYIPAVRLYEQTGSSYTTRSCYASMFAGCTSLIAAPNLPATVLSDGCYRNMFRGCTSLTSAPELPATALTSNCYGGMFSGCTALTSTPVLPATTLASSCYTEMFAGCTSLTEAPELPATTLVNYCYNGMFNGCSGLNYVKCLATNPSTDIDQTYTQDWLSGVASTGTFIKSPGVTGWTRNEDGIPIGWTVYDDGYVPYSEQYFTIQLTDNTDVRWKSFAPAGETYPEHTIEVSINDGPWSSITSSSGGTLIGGSSGDTIMVRGDNTAYATDVNHYSCFKSQTGSFMVYGNIMSLVDSTGFTSAATLSSAWTFANLFRDNLQIISAENLVLPATGLTENCYRNMFYGCFNLTTAPELPAATLVDSCYRSMFDNCGKLSAITCLATDISANNCTYYWTYGAGTSAQSGTFTKAASMTSWTTGNNGIPTGWTVVDAS